EGVVANVAVVPDDDVEGNHIAVAQNAPEGRDTMDDFVVNRDAGVGRIAARTVLIAVTGTAGSEARDPVASRLFQVLRRDARPNELLEIFKHRCGDGTRLAHFRDPLL